MMPLFFYFNKHQKIRNIQNNRLNTINLSGDLCKITKDKNIRTVEDIILNWLIYVSLYHYFIGGAFKTIYTVEWLW